jgi:hypothetical protein
MKFHDEMEESLSPGGRVGPKQKASTITVLVLLDATGYIVIMIQWEIIVR